MNSLADYYNMLLECYNIENQFNKELLLYYTVKALPVHERRCDVQMNIALFVVTIIICPVLTGIIANYLYDKFK
jgi:hypothetical protein